MKYVSCIIRCLWGCNLFCIKIFCDLVFVVLGVVLGSCIMGDVSFYFVYGIYVLVC